MPKPYYGLKADWKQGDGGHLSLAWQDGKSGSLRSFDKARMEELRKRLQGRKGMVEDIRRSVKKSGGMLQSGDMLGRKPMDGGVRGASARPSTGGTMPTLQPRPTGSNVKEQQIKIPDFFRK